MRMDPSSLASTQPTTHSEFCRSKRVESSFWTLRRCISLNRLPTDRRRRADLKTRSVFYTERGNQLLMFDYFELSPSRSRLFQFCQHLSSALNLLFRLGGAWGKSQEIMQFPGGPNRIALLL